MDLTDESNDRHESAASHGRRWTTTTWTTVFVGPSTTEHTRTRTKTGWTETLSPYTSYTSKDPWITKWVTETVAGSASDPSWTTVVTSPTTTTTTTTLTPVTTSTGTQTASPTIENGASHGGFDFGFVAFIGVLTLAVSGLAFGLLWLVHHESKSRKEPPRIVAPVQEDGQGSGDVGQGRDEFYGKA